MCGFAKLPSRRMREIYHRGGYRDIETKLDTSPRLSDYPVKPCGARPCISAAGFAVSGSANTRRYSGTTRSTRTFSPTAIDSHRARSEGYLPSVANANCVGGTHVHVIIDDWASRARGRRSDDQGAGQAKRVGPHLPKLDWPRGDARNQFEE